MSLLETIRQKSIAFAEDTIKMRRQLHANPELSYKEYQTAKFVAENLKAFGLKPQEGVAETGLMVLIEGKNPSAKTVALRADMDALPIEEKNDVPYKSK